MTQSFTFAFWLSSAVFALSLIALILVFRERSKQRVLSAVQLLQAGRILLVHLQRHRGLSTARSAGIKEPIESLSELRDTIVIDMAKISSLNEWFAENENWQGITRHWAGLAVNSERLPADTCFDQHSRLIASLLELMSEVSSHFGLEDHQRYSDTRVIWKEILLVGELIGQCRALGMQVLAGCLTLENKGAYKKIIRSNLSTISVLLENSVCQRHLSQKQIQELELFLAFVRGQVFESMSVVSAMEFFDVASKAIDLIYEQFDIEILRLHRRVFTN